MGPKDDSIKANFWTNKTKENDSIKEDPKKANFWTSKTKKNDTNTEIDLEKKDPKISNLKKKKDLNTKENDKVISKEKLKVLKNNWKEGGFIGNKKEAKDDKNVKKVTEKSYITSFLELIFDNNISHYYIK